MNRVILVIVREFLSVVATRGFILGVLLTPVMIGVAIGGVALVSRLEGPKVAGRVVVVDRSDLTTPYLTKRFEPSAVEEERKELEAKVQKEIDKTFQQIPLPKEAVEQSRGQVSGQVRQAMRWADLKLEPAKPDADLEQLKTEVREAQIRADDKDSGRQPMVALVVIPPGAVRLPPGETKYKAPDIFVTPKLPGEIQSAIRSRVGESIVDARLNTDERFKQTGLAPEQVRAMVATPRPDIVSLTREGGERKSIGPLQVIIPAAFMILLMISIMTGGQYLLTAVVEEKSSRVMEVLLSAVSPMQLMVGKILGQMAVSLVILVVYSGLGIAALLVFALMDLVSTATLVYFVIYFFIAFFTIASLMAAVGAAVNELREAQTLLTPVTMIVMLPWLLWMPIQQAPNSTFATIASFVPGINPFVMVLRMGGTEPIPGWQIPASMLVGFATMAVCAWAAAKVFRIGVLMYGKPPDFRTLIKWIRMA
jgi:ABC-type Na+ efflux pump permease subunit